MNRYHTNTEPVEFYKARTRRQSAALAQIGEPLPDGALDVALSLSSYEAELKERARDDPDRQIRMLKREFALESTVGEPTPLSAAHLEALKILLIERRVDLQALQRLGMKDAEDVGRTARTLDYLMHGPEPPTPERPQQPERPRPIVQHGVVTPISGDPMLTTAQHRGA